jgi:SAM-dependent methyltransferase
VPEAALPARLRALLRPGQFAVRGGRCPFCGPTVFVRLRDDELGVRCLRCRGSAVHLALGRSLRRRCKHLETASVCELSARGPLAAWLRRHAKRVALSEYFAGASPGEQRGAIRHEDVQRLSYADGAFDLVTHTEVLEHVADDAAALRELRRVLKPGGLMLFTVPLHDGVTIERARVRGGAIEHLLPPVHHGDPLRGGAAILAFRDYGRDIVARLRAAGFADAWIDDADAGAVPWGIVRPVIGAHRD